MTCRRVKKFQMKRWMAWLVEVLEEEVEPLAAGGSEQNNYG